MGSTRLGEQLARKNKELKKSQEAIRQVSRRRPHACQNCPRRAQHGSKLCRVCSQKHSSRSEYLINQGCPYFLRETNGTFQWHLEFPELAQWILTTLNLTIDSPLKHSRSKSVKVLGWKGNTDMNEAHDIDGNSYSTPYSY